MAVSKGMGEVIELGAIAVRQSEDAAANEGGGIGAHPIRDPQLALRFLFAGKAIVSLRSLKTDKRYTFKVVAKKGATGVHFVHLLRGPSNEGDFRFLGTVVNRQHYMHSDRSEAHPESPSALGFAWMLRHLVGRARNAAGRSCGGPKVPEALELWHEGRCGRCGRRLTRVESIKSGMGVECARMVGREREALDAAQKTAKEQAGGSQ